MSGPRFIVSGLLIVLSLAAFVLAMPSTGAASTSQRTSTSSTAVPVAKTTGSSASIGQSTDLPLWLLPVGFVVMLAGVAVVGTARRRTLAFA